MQLVYGNNGTYRDHDHKGPEERFRLFVWQPGDETTVEELDVDARDREHANLIGVLALEQDYVPGMAVRMIEGPMTGMYL